MKSTDEKFKKVIDKTHSIFTIKSSKKVMKAMLIRSKKYF